MAVYARSDVMHVAIPVESGGCGEGHSRPVIGGAPAKIWKLTCPRCETYIKDDIARSTYVMTDRDGKKHTVNNSTWGEHQTKTPLTPDEERIAEDLQREGETGVAKLMEGMASAAWAEQNKQRVTEVEQAEKQAAEQAAADRVAQLEAELREMRALVAGIAGSAQKPVDVARAESAARATPKQPGKPRYISAREKASCSSCGGPLRAPGAKGPTPKETCLGCRAKARGATAA